MTARLGMAALCMAGCGGGRHLAGRAAIPSRPAAGACPACNVLLVSIDTLRADHLHTYAYGRDTSPSLDGLARQAVLFEESINTGGGTLAVHASMLTSLPPTVHGVWADSGRVLDPQRVTLAEQLQAVGYRTAAFTGGGYVSASFGLQQGFDRWDDSGGGLAVELPKLYDWLDSHRDERSFVFLHTYDVHSGTYRLPYDHGDALNRRFAGEAPRGYDGCRGGLCASRLLSAIDRDVVAGRRRATDGLSPAEIRYMEGLYDGGIAYADARLGELFAWLAAHGLWDRTLLVVTADHGEEFAEHGLFLHEQNHEEVARVPLLVRFPYARYGGRRLPDLVSTLEVMPTILDAVGVRANPEAMGRSLVPRITGAARPAASTAVYMAGALEKLRTPDWSLFAGPAGPVELYDLRRDPREATDVLAANRATAAALYARYLEAVRRDRQGCLRFHTCRGIGGSTDHVEGAERRRLRALGYLD